MTYTASRDLTKRLSAVLLSLLAWGFAVSPRAPAQSPSGVDGARAPEEPKVDVFARVIANQKRMEADLDVYERIQKVEIRKTGSDANPSETRVLRLFPAGPTLVKIPLSPSASPSVAESYRNDLEKLAKYLAWAGQSGASQREAYARLERKRKDRNDLIVSTHDAFLFTRVGEEMRGDRKLARYRMIPNPKFKPTNRNAMIFSKVSGWVWLDEQAGELARIEGTVTEDISIAMFLARVYKGSHFMQERYELAPGVWLPTYEQFDFDGRKFLLPLSLHERTTYTGFRRVGPPAEALALVRSELDKLAGK